MKQILQFIKIAIIVSLVSVALKSCKTADVCGPNAGIELFKGGTPGGQKTVFKTQKHYNFEKAMKRNK